MTMRSVNNKREMKAVRLLIACLLLVLLILFYPPLIPPLVRGDTEGSKGGGGDLYAFCFDEAGKTYGINPQLLQSIARIESNLNPNAINKNSNGSTDMGIMQVNSSWIASLGLDSGRLVSDPCYNVITGSRILKYCIDKHGYTWEAVGCYNAVSRHKRVDYSWKVYNRLKEEGLRLKAEKSAVNSQQSTVSNTPSLTLPPRGGGQGWGDSKPRTPNSSLFFSVRDNAAIE